MLHSHPPFASMFAAARQPVPAVVDEAVLFLGGDIPVARYATSGSAQVGHNAVRVLADRASALLASHGLVRIAASPAQALHCAVVTEHCAQVAWGTRALGGHAALPASTVQAFGTGTSRPGGQLTADLPALSTGRRIRPLAARMASTRATATTTPSATAQLSASAVPTAGSFGSSGGSFPVTRFQPRFISLRTTNAVPKAATLTSALLAPSPLSAMHPP